MKVFLLPYVLDCVWNDIHFGNYLIYNIGFVDRHLSQSSSVLFTLVFESSCKFKILFLNLDFQMF